MAEDEIIPVHKDSWNHRELLQRILSRYCHVLEDIGGRTPAYLVSEKSEEEDFHETLASINSHFKTIGYNARLYPDEPWIIQLIPDPKYQWPSPKFVISMWVLSLLTTVYAGEKWMGSGRPTGGWFVENASLDALVGFTLPLFAVLILASFIQKWTASKSGVRLPHLFPLPGPAMLWWPFGIIGFASLPRSDARLWPDRSSLGKSALSVPIVMIVCGMALSLLGLKLTPDIVPITASPLILDLPLLVNLLGINMVGETSMLLKTSWSHPFTLVGTTLMFFGWISLLPIPTFPGGRILIARMGIPEARSGSTQVMLLMVVLLFAFLFGAFSEWSIWVPVVALCASLLITKGSDPRLPIVLDDFKGLPDVDHRRIGIILFMAFMFALPSQIPFSMDDNWDEEISWDIDDKTLVIEEGWFNQTITVSNPSLIVQGWDLTLLSTMNGDFTLSSSSCDSELQDNVVKCEGDINPEDPIDLEFDFEWKEDWNTTGIDFIWRIGNEFITHKVVPDQTIYPVGSWQFNGDIDDPKSCIELQVNGKSSTINLASIEDYTSWDGVDDNGNLTVDKHTSEICLNSLKGDDMKWLDGYLFNIDDTSYKTAYESQNFVSIPKEGIVLDNNELMFSQSILALNHEDDCLSLGNPSSIYPLVDEIRSWNMSITPVGLNQFEDSNDSIRFFAPSGSIITDCQQYYLPSQFTVLEGPSLIIGQLGERTQHWIGSVNVIDDEIIIENPNSENITLNIEFDGNGTQWDISNNIVLNSGQITTVSAIAPETGMSFAWFELNDGEIILHLVNHEV